MNSYNKNKKSLITTVAIFVICLVIVTGSTFSLFTSESKVNIAVTSGNVDVKAIVGDYTLTSMGKPMDNDTFENGGTVYFDEDTAAFTITNITPGDYVTIPVTITNDSTVKVMYRVLCNVDGALNGQLDAFVNGFAMNGYVGEWNALDPTTEEPEVISVSIGLADDKGDDAENLTTATTITLKVEAVQANGATTVGGNKTDVYTAKGLEDAVNAGFNEITLKDDVVITDTLIFDAPATTTYSLRSTPVVVNLNGNTITIADKNAVRNDGAALVIQNGSIVRTGDVVGYAVNNASGSLVLNNVTVTGGVYTSGSALEVNDSTITHHQSSRHAIYSWDCNVTIENSVIHNYNAGNAAIMAAGASVVQIDSGVFSIADGRPVQNWTSCLLDVNGTASFIINGGTFNGGFRVNSANATMTINGGSFNDVYGSNYNIYGGTVTVNGGEFTDNAAINFAKKYVAEGYLFINNGDGTCTVYANTSSTVMTLKSGAVLDLGGVEFLGKVVAEGDLTIKGDAKIKTLTAVNGGTITVENSLVLNNFSFGSKDTAGSEYTITGGTITANYGFFQHGVYDLYSNFETGYMYYSYGSDITVYGTFHSQGKGDGLDYVRGKLTIAEGGKSIHDKSLWVGQPASWGAMSASLTVEKGGYVQANSLSVYEGSVAYNDVANVGVEGVGVKYNTLSGKISAIASDVTGLVAAINAGGEVTLVNDITATDIIFIDKSVTINGNGHKVTSSATRVFRVRESDVELTMNNVNIVATGEAVNGVELRGVSVDNTTSNVKLTLNECSVELTDPSAVDWAYAVAFTGGSSHTLIVNGGSYDGANVINVRGTNNTVVVKNATLTSDYPDYSNPKLYGACIWVQTNMGSTVEATGNTFNGYNAIAFNIGNTQLTESNNVDNTVKAAN